MVKPINHFSLETPATVYDEEAMTALVLAARTAGKVNECVAEVNRIPAVADAAVQKVIDDGTLDKKVDKHYTKLVNTVEASITAMENAEEDLGKRLDNLLGAVTEGSTSGDAELIDARQDNNGDVWPNAGTNIRMMQKETASLLGALTHDVVADTSKVIVPGWYDATGAHQENDNYVCFTRDVTPGEVYYYGGVYGYDCSGVLCLDSANNVIKTWFTKEGGSATQAFTTPIVIPPNGVKLLVNSGMDLLQRFEVVPNLVRVADREMNIDTLQAYLANVMATIPNSGNLYVDAGERTTGKYLLRYGIPAADETGKYEIIVATVSPGETYHIRAESHYKNGLYALCNEANIPVEYVSTNNRDGKIETVEKDIIIPQGVKYIRVAGMPAFAGAKGALCQKLIERRALGIGVWSHLKWACLGDSLTEENTRTDKHYFDYVHEKTGIQVVNMGADGSGYAAGTSFYSRAASVPADCDVVTIFGSGNDGTAGLALGDAADTFNDGTLCGYINGTIDAIYEGNPDVKLGIVSPSPWYGQIPEDTTCFMYKYSNALKAICERRGIPFLDLFRLSGFRTTNADGTLNATTHTTFFSKDPDETSCHPNEVGHKHLSSHFYRFLDSLIGTY